MTDRSYLGIHLAIATLFYLVMSKETFQFEKLHRYGLGNRIFNLHDRYCYPDPLPTMTPSPLALIRSPYHSLYQGAKGPHDRLVYNKRFKYGPKAEGHHVFSKANFDCTLTHLSLETEEGVPVVLRGGAGRMYFDVAVRAPPGTPLAGHLRAYCRNGTSTHFLR